MFLLLVLINVMHIIYIIVLHLRRSSCKRVIIVVIYGVFGLRVLSRLRRCVSSLCGAFFDIFSLAAPKIIKTVINASPRFSQSLNFETSRSHTAEKNQEL
jgi:TctA family transporter